MIQLKRAYEDPTEADGSRVLVDRIWPRGVSREDAALEGWLKDVAPSDELRKWFDHDPEKWEEFRRRYAEELASDAEKREAVELLREKAAEGKLTLVYGAKDAEHNNARALKEYLESRDVSR